MITNSGPVDEFPCGRMWPAPLDTTSLDSFKKIESFANKSFLAYLERLETFALYNYPGRFKQIKDESNTPSGFKGMINCILQDFA